MAELATAETTEFDFSVEDFSNVTVELSEVLAMDISGPVAARCM